jgi:3-oxoacyl-[acyl-carrier-protein] synthase II
MRGRDLGWTAADPLALLKLLPDMAASNLAVRFGAKGPVITVVAACVSSTQAIGQALNLIRSGAADVVLAGGTEAPVTRIGVAGFCLLRALSVRNEEPERASRPFDAGRDGFVLSEGSAILVIEELQHARRRTAPVLAELRGYAQTSDAQHLVQPDRKGQGAARCIELALMDAGISAEEVDYINAHGTSTVLNDIAETSAVKLALGRNAYDIPISSIKSMIGHTLGAAGAIETVAAIKTLETGILPPTVNLDEPDPQCDLDYVPNDLRECDVEIVLKNSFGFGGQNACLVLSKVVGA